jgi:hypothetical protein
VKKSASVAKCGQPCLTNISRRLSGLSTLTASIHTIHTMSQARTALRSASSGASSSTTPRGPRFSLNPLVNRPGAECEYRNNLVFGILMPQLPRVVVMSEPTISYSPRSPNRPLRRMCFVLLSRITSSRRISQFQIVSMREILCSFSSDHAPTILPTRTYADEECSPHARRRRLRAGTSCYQSCSWKTIVP